MTPSLRLRILAWIAGGLCALGALLGWWAEDDDGDELE